MSIAATATADIRIHTDCPTCICGDTRSLDYFNRRCARLMREHPIDLSGIGEERLSASDKFRCGFREFLLSASSVRLGALFMLSIHPFARPEVPEGYSVRHGQASCSAEDEKYEISRDAYRAHSRYFAVMVQRPGSPPLPVEYNPGDCFDMHDAVTLEDYEQLVDLADVELLGWLDAHRAALRDFAIAATSAAS